ncbi:class II aldolase/adducin family protein [Halorubrum vacuolatum]|uniref:L-fuculose 1-phosphate aldolase n=1 Tax=Halorubrum vacuolatum TaxID=63740 RepID=A0A238XMN3_HALVU|nr:class II aldolase/adducin family protein [Halorubrum vacuolatum]SNR59614.1 L-fuculose 1-phosphate aldolase [Halorubrum vacuolatum]
MTNTSGDDATGRDAREAVKRYGREMLEKGLTKATGGNVSRRTGPEGFAISPSGVPYPEIEPEDVPILDLDGDVVHDGKKPSNEVDMHRLVYAARDDVGGIVHTHSPYASTFASLNDPIRPSHYLIAFIGDKVPVAEYVTYGTEALGRKAVAALGEEYNACLLANHGVLAVGDTLGSALETAEMVEYCARIHYQARAIGEPELLPDEEVDHLREKFADYGEER